MHIRCFKIVCMKNCAGFSKVFLPLAFLFGAWAFNALSWKSALQVCTLPSTRAIDPENGTYRSLLFLCRTPKCPKKTRTSFVLNSSNAQFVIFECKRTCVWNRYGTEYMYTSRTRHGLAAERGTSSRCTRWTRIWPRVSSFRRERGCRIADKLLSFVNHTLATGYSRRSGLKMIHSCSMVTNSVIEIHPVTLRGTNEQSWVLYTLWRPVPFLWWPDMSSAQVSRSLFSCHVHVCTESEPWWNPTSKFRNTQDSAEISI